MSGQKPATKLPAVATPDLGGVTIKRHVLDLEAGSLAWTMRRLGHRIRYWLNKTKAAQTLPDKDMRETITLWSGSIMALLKEQRERARLVPGKGAPVISDEDYAVALRELVAEQVRAMPTDELEQLLSARTTPKPIEVPE